MEKKVLGLHHITAIAGDAQRNHAFYTNVLGMRLVKKTVNFDDPGTYHFYFADKVGTPGTLLTFFPWEGVRKGTQGPGQTTEITYSLPEGSIPFWRDRLANFGVEIRADGKRFGEEFISFEDPDGLPLTFLVSSSNDNRIGWETAEVKAGVAPKGFHSVTLTLRRQAETVNVLELLGYKLTGQEGERYRYATDAVGTASIVDIVESKGPAAVNAGGTIHHIAFRVKDEQTQAEVREMIVRAGYSITPKIDRNYFYSLYFREPGGVLFEIATDNPGFEIDESVEELGSHLMLPSQYENNRAEIEKILPVLG
jgi:glyoxalase family protein